jgi:Holliday junction resolvase RusA-like endonuclease
VSLFEGPDVISFEVGGIPVTQGSVRAILPRGSAQPIVVQGSSAKARKSLDGWRSDIASQARAWTEGHPGFVPLVGPVQLKLSFHLVRPTSHPKTRRTWPVGKNSGDLDKLVRAVFDALTGVLFIDDGQVVGLVTSKDYSPAPGCSVRLRAVADSGLP